MDKCHTIDTFSSDNVLLYVQINNIIMMNKIEEMLQKPEEMLQNRDILKQVALANPEFFAKYYLGVSLPAHQKNWMNLWKTSKRDLLLAPRDHGKSTVINYINPIYEICKNRNIRILQISKTQGQAKKFLSLIAEELTKNKKLIEDFGDFRSKHGWRSDYIFVKRSKTMKDPTVEACGVEGAITGGHFDIIIADDIVDEENTKTQERMENVKNWFFGTIGQLAEPQTKIFVVGTRKHYSDLYNHIIEKKKGYRVHIDKAILKWPDSWTYLKDPDTKQVVDVEVNGESKVLWEERWGIKELLMDKLNSGSVIFDREKQNDPSGMRGRFFDKEWLQYYSERPDLRMIFQGVDLAISENPDADYFVVVTLGIDHNNNIYVLDYFRDHLTFDQQVSKIKEKHSNWQPLKIFVEKNAYQQALSQHLISSTTLPVVPINTVKDKVTRMLGLSPYFEQRRMFIREEMAEFQREYLHFPKGEHDDILDALDLSMMEIKRGATRTDIMAPDAVDVY